MEQADDKSKVVKLDFYAVDSDSDTDGDSDDCYEIDPIEFYTKLTLSSFDDGEVAVVAEKGPVSLRDFPHPRHLCGNYPFSKTAPESYCSKCFCYSCEVVAPCSEWWGSDGHCNIFMKKSSGPPSCFVRSAMPTMVQQGIGVAARPAMRKPVFVKVDQLKPNSYGHTLVVKVVSLNIVLQKGEAASAHLRQMKIAECLVGDETGAIIFTARNEQVDMMTGGATVIIRNGKINMFKGFMRLVVDKWGRLDFAKPATFTVKDNNLSLVEYKLINAAEE